MAHARGEYGQRLHMARFRDLSFALIQMDELYAKVKDEEKVRWLWLAIDPVGKALPALRLGSRRAEDMYALVHELKRRLHPACDRWAAGVLSRDYGAFWPVVSTAASPVIISDRGDNSK